jgi:hypothetical protein
MLCGNNGTPDHVTGQINFIHKGRRIIDVKNYSRGVFTEQKLPIQ